MTFKLQKRLITTANSQLSDHYVVADSYRREGLHLIVEGHFCVHLSSVINYVVKHGYRETDYQVQDYERRLIELGLSTYKPKNSPKKL